jgi:hypothetical protein
LNPHSETLLYSLLPIDDNIDFQEKRHFSRKVAEIVDNCYPNIDLYVVVVMTGFEYGTRLQKEIDEILIRPTLRVRLGLSWLALVLVPFVFQENLPSLNGSRRRTIVKQKNKQNVIRGRCGEARGACKLAFY